MSCHVMSCHVILIYLNLFILERPKFVEMISSAAYDVMFVPTPLGVWKMVLIVLCMYTCLVSCVCVYLFTYFILLYLQFRSIYITFMQLIDIRFASS